ncbi:MAG: YitT family protein [Firmicutes bacterium]|nr:YitT family protein [Bacillota bacterium]
MIIGSFIAAAAISLFLAPNKITGGGINGVAIVLHYFLRYPVGIITLVLNIPLFMLGIWSEGKGFGIKSIYATILMSVFIDLLEGLPAFTDDVFLAGIFGGLLMGVGLGLVFVSGATTGGTDIIAKLVQKAVRHLSIGKILLTVDILVILTAMIAFKDIHVGLYSAIALYVSTHMIDLLMEGGKFAKTVFIISEKSSDIAENIKTKLERGVTGLVGKGMYSGGDKMVLMCTVKRKEVPLLKDLVKQTDSSAFVILTDVREVLGEGFLAD